VPRRYAWVGAVLEPPGMEARLGRLCVELDPDAGLLGYGGGCPPGAPVLGGDSLLAPGLCNAHLHLPDAAVADAGEDLGLHELVAQPTGAKYRLLSSTPRSRVEAAVRDLLRLYRSEGVLVLVGYAEGGFHRLALEAASREGVLLRVAAQPAEKRLDEALGLLATGYWVGLDTPLDMEPWELRALAGAASSRGSRLAAHVSEDEALARLGDLEAALDAGVHVLVHMTHRGPGAALEAHRAGASIVFCPAANLYFSSHAPDPRGLIALYDEEAAAGLGSDNAAWPPQGVGWLLAAAYTLYRAGLSGGDRLALARSLLYAATTGCGRVASASVGWQIRRVPLLPYSHEPTVAIVKRLHQSRLLEVVERPAWTG